MKKILATFFVLLGLSSIAEAHGGYTDAQGCHYDYSSYTKSYHCHNRKSGGYNDYYLVYKGQAISRHSSLSACTSAKYRVANQYIDVNTWDLTCVKA